MLYNNLLLYCIVAIVFAFIVRLIPSKYKATILLIGSGLFYIASDYRFALLLAVQIGISFALSKKVYRNKAMLSVGVCICSSSLMVVKALGYYTNLFGSAINVLIPLGISYYTFKIISYLVECYKCEETSDVSLLVYANYVSFFPQIVCGPIARVEGLMAQIKAWEDDAKEELVDEDDLTPAIVLILSGLFKKVVIADRISGYVGQIFGGYNEYPALALIMAAFLYSVELYCDFAGYSEIAIGVAQIMGIKTEKNFNLPYFAYSISDFWRRWHISLSSWLRDYIYIPIGGKNRRVINILITFFVSGLWHGNSLNYLLWGLYHGALSCVRIKPSKKPVVKWLQIVANFFVVCLGWIIFGITDIRNLVAYIARMLRGIGKGFLSIDNITYSVLPFTGDNKCVAYFLTVMLMVFILFMMELREYREKKQNVNVRVVIYVVCIVLFGVFGENSFIYANF